MGKRGPKPTPTPILKLRGSWRGNSRGPDIQCNQKRPACPKRFITRQKTADGEAVRQAAQRVWNRLCSSLHKAGLLTDNYREPFEALCDSYGRFLLACSKCDDDCGMVTVTDKGAAIQTPWFAIRNKMFEQVYKGAASFGLTPADLSAARAIEKPSENEGKSKFFARGAS